MTNKLSDWAREFIREEHVAVIGTLNKDGSSHLTTVWYLLADDGTVILTTPAGSQKFKNLQRDPRIALCVGGPGRSISLYGKVTISEDRTLIQQEIKCLVERYVKDEGMRQQFFTFLAQRSPVSLHFIPEKITEFAGAIASSRAG